MTLVPRLPTDECALDPSHIPPAWVVVDDAEAGWLPRGQVRVWCTQAEQDEWCERIGGTL